MWQLHSAKSSADRCSTSRCRGSNSRQRPARNRPRCSDGSKMSDMTRTSIPYAASIPCCPISKGIYVAPVGRGREQEAGDFLTADQASLNKLFGVAVFGLLAATDEALPDLKRNGEGALLVSNGAFGLVSPEIDEIVINLHLMGLALSSAAKHKLVGLL